MNNNYSNNGYLHTINQAIRTVRGFHGGLVRSSLNREESMSRLAQALSQADGILIGAGAGLSTSAGFTYSGERFERYFADFAQCYGFSDMYSGGFYPYPSKEEFWAYWSRYIYINRYLNPPKPVYEKLLELVKDKDYFVITTNVDHCFQKVGFAKDRLFYTQGDYGLFQSTDPANQKTYDNREWVEKALIAQGFVRNEKGELELPKEGKLAMRIPSELIPVCPDDGHEFTLNLRSDDSFVEDEGWQRASRNYGEYLTSHQDKKMLYLELGVGMNTPVIIKYPFWAMTYENPQATYGCINYSEASCPSQIAQQAILISDDIGAVLSQLRKQMKDGKSE
jgi:NAD-dependent SIR2 family protein deacetylase